MVCFILYYVFVYYPTFLQKGENSVVWWKQEGSREGEGGEPAPLAVFFPISWSYM